MNKINFLEIKNNIFTYSPPRFLFRRYVLIRLIKKGIHFLEVVPGNLKLSIELLKFFQRGTLIDFNPNIKQIYDELNIETKQRLDLIIDDIFTSRSLSTAFNCIVACEVLEHLENDCLFLDKVYDLLEDKGQLVLSVPSRMKYWSKHDDIVGHYRRYEKQEIFEKLSAANFSQISVISYGFPFVNLFRLGRILLAWIQYKKKIVWDKKTQSQQSAFIQRISILNFIGLFINRYTIAPLSLFSSPFNYMDLSDGYVVSAIKDVRK